MKVLNLFLIIALIVLFFFILVIAKDFLIPLVLAIFMWYLINVLAGVFQKIRIFKKSLPTALTYLVSVFAILGALSFVVNLITNNIANVVEAAPNYQENISRIINRGFALFHVDKPPDLGQLFKDMDLSAIISQIAGAMTGFVGNVGLIVLYLFFIFLEQKFYRKKLMALLPDNLKRQEIVELLSRVDSDVRKYIGIKTLISALTGFLGYIIMFIVGLDFAEFWAFLLFILNFIPYIGSLVATLLPALLALVQFDTLTPFIIVGGGIQTVQIVVANVIEPRLLGHSLNLSPLVIILALVVWGTLWGIPGMFFCVPITVILMIVFSHFPQTRRVAILLSKDGNLKKV